MIDNIEKRRRLYSVLDWCSGALLIALGATFIVSCFLIYIKGDNPFTRESVGEALLRLLIPIIVTLVFMTFTSVVHILYPLPEEKLKAVKNTELSLKRAARGRALSDMPDETALTVKRERLLRALAKYVNLSLLALGILTALIYSFIPENLTDDLNLSVIGCTVCICISLLPSLILYSVRLITDRASVNRELAALNSTPRTAETVGVSDTRGIRAFFVKNRVEILLGVRIALIASAGVYILLGVQNGGMKDVIDKAIKICTECIGLG